MIKKSIESNQNSMKKMNMEEDEISFPMVKSSLNSYVRSDEVILEWSDLPDKDHKYQLYRNGKPITKITGERFRDTNVDADKFYNYKIIGYKKISRRILLCKGI
ncbi:hypothetical protein [Paludifilum halophilum]|uniref:Fibronectin type-III domain-containing protein n=1 Tax=Paludifilum halophilum TaxID=1642702 RepID=A0A235B6K3_9BACL|nr:hypothetical protein [Paludifilum halophilum]OYD07619.1 hypothetical protein CHM34_09055 [Paludifilum halophilum]